MAHLADKEGHIGAHHRVDELAGVEEEECWDRLERVALAEVGKRVRVEL